MVQCFQQALKLEKPDSTLNIKQWTEDWLNFKGPSQIACSYADEKLTIKQDFPAHADQHYRSQAMQVLLVFPGGEHIKLPHIVIESQHETVVSVNIADHLKN
jgi:hypothetical protein